MRIQHHRRVSRVSEQPNRLDVPRPRHLERDPRESMNLCSTHQLPLPLHNARRTSRLPPDHRIPSIDRAIQNHRPLHLSPPRRFRRSRSVRAGRIHAPLIAPMFSSDEKLLDAVEALLPAHPLSISTD